MLSKPYSSNETVGGPERSGNRTYMYGLGLDEENLKRPFIFVIMDEVHHIPVFMGYVMNPAQK